MLALNRKVTYVVAALAFTSAGVVILVNSTQSAGGYIGVTREFYLFNVVNENIDEKKLGIAPDQFSQTQITVRKGDTVRIHFYNVEPLETKEVHTFTILEGPYQMDYKVNAGEHVTIEFKAEHRGIWEFVCTEHKPTMRGELVVL